MTYYHLEEATLESARKTRTERNDRRPRSLVCMLCLPLKVSVEICPFVFLLHMRTCACIRRNLQETVFCTWYYCVMLAETAYAIEASIDLNCRQLQGIGRFWTANCCVVPKKIKSELHLSTLRIVGGGMARSGQSNSAGSSPGGASTPYVD